MNLAIKEQAPRNASLFCSARRALHQRCNVVDSSGLVVLNVAGNRPRTTTAQGCSAHPPFDLERKMTLEKVLDNFIQEQLTCRTSHVESAERKERGSLHHL